MRQEEVTALFERQAPDYDRQWARMAPLRDCLHLLLKVVFAPLPEDARLLCVGAGTGAEIGFLARLHPGWQFMALDPSPGMIERCRSRAVDEGFATRCEFHEGYLESLPAGERYDAATCLLVSQFILDPVARTDLFRAIASRLRADGILASADLASDVESDAYRELLTIWFGLMSSVGVTPEALQRMRGHYARDVGILPPAAVAGLLANAGFETPTQFFQGGLIHAWSARRSAAAGK